MSIAQARQTALKLQQELIDLDLDVKLKLGPFTRDLHGTRHTVQAIAVIIDISGGKTTQLYIDEDNYVWGNGDSWGSTFPNQKAWSDNIGELAITINARIPSVDAARHNVEKLLKKYPTLLKR